MLNLKAVAQQLNESEFDEISGLLMKSKGGMSLQLLRDLRREVHRPLDDLAAGLGRRDDAMVAVLALLLLLLLRSSVAVAAGS